MHNLELKKQTYRKLLRVMENYKSLMFEPVGRLQAEGLETREHFRRPPETGWQPLAEGQAWGGLNMNLWVRGRFTVPESAAGKSLYVRSHADGREQLLFVNGVPKGIFSWKHGPDGGAHDSRLLSKNAAPGDVYDLALECWDRQLEGGEDRFDAASRDTGTDPLGPDTPGRVYGGVEIAALNEAVKDLYFDMRELLMLGLCDEGDEFLRARARRVLDGVAGALTLCPQHYEKEQWMQGVRASLALTRPFFARRNTPALGRVGLIGHSHLDTAWLWTVDETVRKAARTFSTAVSLLEEYPHMKFMQSSALHAAWLKEYYPAVFEKIREFAAAGRYELNGGVWVECDCNITSGESMVRQFMLGQRFSRENFGRAMDTFWLPDTFGYHANIPQIMLGCGVKYFVTNKVNVNEINKPLHESFLWRGIDGSTVLAHIPVSGGHADVRDVLFTAGASMKDKDATDKHLLCFGYGDGGGGPTWGMAEETLRVSGIEGMPEAKMQTVSEFLGTLDAEDRAYLPVIDDELYFEFHRGTLTQNHGVKRGNRKAEFALRDAEYFAALAGAAPAPGHEAALKTILLNQFHDILPGTCIAPVYENHRRETDETVAFLQNEAAGFADALQTPEDGAIGVYNTLPFARRDALVLEGETPVAGLPCQTYTDLYGNKKTAVGGLRVPGFGAVTLQKGSPAAAEPPFVWEEETGRIETPFARATLADNGGFASFTDKASGRELRAPGDAPLNTLWTAEDCPEKWDNWNIDSDAIDRLAPAAELLERRLVSIGPVELRLRQKIRVSAKTTLTQDIVFYADSPRVDFHTLTNWNDKHLLLKAGFALNLRAREARNEIQFGHVKRPTHRSTPCDLAKFEVCNHKWTDVSENGFGAAVLNDCKYGVSVYNCEIMLTLHRAGSEPDATGDAGVHETTYSLLPHAGAFCAENTVYPAYALNVPYVTRPGRSLQTAPFLTVDAPNVICETVKPAENGAGRAALRLYECEGTAAEATLTPGFAFRRAYLTDMLEENRVALPAEEGRIRLRFGAFEIKTVVLE